MAYRNGGKQAKRIARKLGEANFDGEILRDFMLDIDYNQVEEWDEVIGDLDCVLYALTSAKELAVAARDALKSDPPVQGDTVGTGANPFAQKKTETPGDAKNAMKGSQKGG